MSVWIKKSDNPFSIFQSWYVEAQEQTVFEPTAMTLATVSSDGMPSARVVLLKRQDENGFCFFTNFESVKGNELKEKPKAALVFHWQKPIHRQVRVRGLVEKMSFEESSAYFKTRDRGSQIGAWSSPQSQEIQSREELEQRIQLITEKYPEGEVPCPENWGGYRVQPLSIEFWEAQDFRLHDRIKFTRNDLKTNWQARYLAP